MQELDRADCIAEKIEQLVLRKDPQVPIGLSSSKMARITSECDAMRIHEHQMALITSECDAMRVHEHQMVLITSECDANAQLLQEIDRLLLPHVAAARQGGLLSSNSGQNGRDGKNGPSRNGPKAVPRFGAPSSSGLPSMWSAGSEEPPAAAAAGAEEIPLMVQQAAGEWLLGTITARGAVGQGERNARRI